MATKAKDQLQGDGDLAEQLQALDDLDREHQAGDLDTADYHNLREEYTIRVADTMRRLNRRRATPPTGAVEAKAAPAKFRGLAALAPIVALTAFAIGAGWLLAQATGERGVGETITGQIDSPRQRVQECQDLGVDGLVVESLQCFDDVLVGDPDNVEALTYRGWFVILTTSSAELSGQADEAAELLEVGRTYLDRAIEVDPSYPDARAFRAVVFDRLGEAEQACREVGELLDLDPPPFFVEQTSDIVTRNNC